MLRKAKKRVFVGDNTTIKWTHEGVRYCLHIRADECPESPREWSNLAKMACWHRDYNLGDKIDAETPELFWRRMVRDYCTSEEVADAILAGKLGGIRLAPNEENPELFDLYETYYIRTVIGRSEASESLEREGIKKSDVLYWVEDDLDIEHCQELLEPYLEWLNLYLYDHSGITISCSHCYPYNDRWDSGQVGWIIADKETIIKEVWDYELDENGERIRVETVHSDGKVSWHFKMKMLTDETWRARAIEIMEGEVEVYDQYLRGEVYGYNLYRLGDAEGDEDEEFDEDDAEEADRCWGFFGDDLLENGIPDQVGCGLQEALESGEYEEGRAVLHRRSYYTF